MYVRVGGKVYGVKRERADEMRDEKILHKSGLVGLKRRLGKVFQGGIWPKRG